MNIIIIGGRYPNDSYDRHKQSLYQLNDQFSNFSSQLDINKSKNFHLQHQTSGERIVRYNDKSDFYNEGVTLNSNRMGSEFEAMTKTLNSIGSFNQNEQYIPQYPLKTDSNEMNS